MTDLNNKELSKGDIIDIHQTVNGNNLFVLMELNPLMVVYNNDLKRTYEYDVEELLELNQYEKTIEVVGNIYVNKHIKPIEMLSAKLKNKRVFVYVLKDDRNDTMAVRVFTKTLTDFRKRSIIKTDNLYSIETLAVLSDLFGMTLEGVSKTQKDFGSELNKVIENNYVKINKTF